MPGRPLGRRLISNSELRMRRIFAILFGLLVVVLAGGFLSLGAFPPRAPQHAVHQLIANDRLAPA